MNYGKLNRRTFIKGIICRMLVSLGIIGSGVLPVNASAIDKTTERPNVIIVMPDDQGYGDFSCYGNPVVKTPHLDKLGNESLILTDFHVAPMCTPTRSQVMTGIDACRTGSDFVAAGRVILDTSYKTMAEIFKEGDYNTAMFGKWHIGSNYPYIPGNRGFDETVFFTGAHIGSASDFWNNDYYNPTLLHNNKPRKYRGYAADIFFNEAISWIRKQTETSSNPFFVYLPVNSIHGPHWCPDKYKKLYPDMPGLLQTVFGTISNLDENMGKLDKALDELGISDNTILIYFSDNGPMNFMAEFYNAGMRGYKRQYYEGGHRVPCFIRWRNGNWNNSKSINVPTQAQDLLPTLVDLCGFNKGAKDGIDGKSLANDPDASREFQERMFVVQYGETHGPSKYKAAVVWKHWRLVNGDELYNIKEDPAQEVNIINEQKAIADKMKSFYESWWSTIDPMKYIPNIIGDENNNPIMLTSEDWAFGYACTQPGEIRPGKRVNGFWHLKARKAGNYRITLSRWPQSEKIPIDAGVPKFVGKYGGYAEGKALPIKGAKIDIAGIKQSKTVKSDDWCIAFNVRLPAGDMKFKSFFTDKDDKEICGSYYAKVEYLN